MSGQILDSASITTKPQVGCKSHLAEIQLQLRSLLRKDEWFAQNKTARLLQEQAHVGDLVTHSLFPWHTEDSSKMAHLNTTSKSFPLLIHVKHRSVQEFLAAPPLCYILLVSDFFHLAWLGIPKILTENKKNPQKAQVKKGSAGQ